MTTKEDIKKKASGFISMVSGLTEKAVHTIIEKGAAASGSIEEGISKAYKDIKDNLAVWMKAFKEKSVQDLQPGDIIISPVDVVIDGKVKFQAGQIFEFTPEFAHYIKTPVFEPDVRTAAAWARVDENQKTMKIVVPYTTENGQVDTLNEYLRARNEEIKKEQAYKETETAAA